MKYKYLVVALIFIFIMTSCSEKNKVSENSSKEVVLKTENSKISNNAASKKASEEIWDLYADKYGKDPKQAYYAFEPDLYLLYIEGMKHKNSYVRWCAVHSAFQYSGYEKKKEIIEAVKPLLSDLEENVRKVAQFTYSILTFSFEGDEFIKSPNGKKVVFTDYTNERFNDGKLWQYDSYANQVSVLRDFGLNIGIAAWSPDSKKICVSSFGRIDSDVNVIDADTGVTIGHDLFSYIIKTKNKYNYKIGKSPRPDPWITFLEWSPDSSKVLFFYSFNDDDGVRQSGTAVYNLEKQMFQTVGTNKATSEIGDPPIEKPKGFHW